jgi:hypothetical protein
MDGQYYTFVSILIGLLLTISSNDWTASSSSIAAPLAYRLSSTPAAALQASDLNFRLGNSDHGLDTQLSVCILVRFLFLDFSQYLSQHL